MMSDHISLEDLSAHLDGELSAARAVQVEAHLATCPECRAEHEALLWTVSFVAAMPPVPLPPGTSVRLPTGEARAAPLAPGRRALGWLTGPRVALGATASIVLLFSAALLARSPVGPASPADMASAPADAGRAMADMAAAPSDGAAAEGAPPSGAGRSAAADPPAEAGYPGPLATALARDRLETADGPRRPTAAGAEPTEPTESTESKESTAPPARPAAAGTGRTEPTAPQRPTAAQTPTAAERPAATVTEVPAGDREAATGEVPDRPPGRPSASAAPGAGWAPRTALAAVLAALGILFVARARRR